MSKHRPDQPVNRRSFLKGLGVAGMAGTAATLAPSRTTLAGQEAAGRTPNRRKTRTTAATPPLNVLVFTKLAFGHRPGDLEAFNSLGGQDSVRLSTWLEQQLTPDFNNDPLLQPKLAAAGFESLGKSLTQLWADHRLNPNNLGWSYRLLPFTETRNATFLRAVYSQWQLFEVMVDFWHNHFNVRASDGNIAPVFVHYDRDVIRANAFGNFRTLLEAVATSPAMLYYLDNYLNSDGGPNENYARELFELQALGAENYLGAGLLQSEVPGYPTAPVGYVDNDVYEAARAFTGWRVRDDSYRQEIGNTGEFFFYTDWHDRFQKKVLGWELLPDPAAMEHGRAVLDALAQHPGTGRYVCRKLCRRLISDNPPDSLVEEAAAVFTANWQAADQIKKVLRIIIYSTAFSETWGEKMKRPFEFAASALRATAANFNDFEQIRWYYESTGQRLFEWAPPTGYPDTREYWQSTVGMLQRWRLAIRLVDEWDDDDNNLYIDLPAQTPPNLLTANQMVDFWSQRILGRALENSDARGELVDFVADGRNPDSEIPASDDLLPDRIRTLVISLLNAPDFQWR